MGEIQRFGRFLSRLAGKAPKQIAAATMAVQLLSEMETLGAAAIVDARAGDIAAVLSGVELLSRKQAELRDVLKALL